MTDPCTQIDKITESKTHIEHMINDIAEIKSGVRELTDSIGSMKGFAAGVAAAASIFVNIAFKAIGVVAAHAATMIK